MIDVRFTTWRNLFFAAIVFSVGCQSFKVVSQASIDHQAAKSRQVYSEGMCEAAVQMFAAGTPDRDTVAAVQFVESAGVEAFPALLNPQVLNGSNVRDWLSQREGKTLGELRVECARLSLEKAKEMQEGDSSDNAKEYVEFFVDNLRQVRFDNR